MANMAGAIGAKAARIVGHWISVAVLAVVVFVRSAALSLTRRRPTWPRSAAVLSGRNLEDQLDTTRELDNQEEKRTKADFALWKNAPPEHIMRWPSPWGDGFPGWHIECSAMSNKYLGAEFDIHGGGMDLQFPHHECEIAQSAVCNHKTMAKYWIHNNMITINGRKMGKSYNNVIKLSELFTGSHPLLAQAYHPMTIRFFILQSHYRSPLDFGNDALKASEKAFKRLWEAYEILMKFEVGYWQMTDIELDAKVNKLVAEFDEFLNDDFSTAKVLANMFELVPIINGIKDQHIAIEALQPTTITLLQQQMKAFIEDIFGLKHEDAGGNKLKGIMELLITLRKDAKAKKDFVTSDRIRNKLATLGVLLKDEKGGDMSYTIE